MTVLLALRYFYYGKDHIDDCHPSKVNIQSVCGLSEAPIKRALNELEDMGAIIRESGKSSDTGNKANTYWFPWDYDKLSDLFALSKRAKQAYYSGSRHKRFIAERDKVERVENGDFTAETNYSPDIDISDDEELWDTVPYNTVVPDPYDSLF